MSTGRPTARVIAAPPAQPLRALAVVAEALPRDEYLADLMVHVAGVLFGLVGAIALIDMAADGDAVLFASTITYALGLLAMLGCSCAYNVSCPLPKTSWLRRADHAAIFVMIAGSITPFALQGEPSWRLAGLALIWSIALGAAAVKLLRPGRHEREMIYAYVALGWSGLVLLAAQVSELPREAAVLLITGVVIYTGGVFFHLSEKLRFSRALWHACVLTAAVCHYLAIRDGVVLSQLMPA
ncbi:MAG: hemolysin III family protein [Alphaproteobacteria bacterium]|nr:hemolysin III family protein [Alphaproteobacteria bacterium]